MTTALREKWRATLYTDGHRERFDKLADRFDATDLEAQGRMGAIAEALVVLGGPVSSLHAAYLNYILDVCRAVAQATKTKEAP